MNTKDVYKLNNYIEELDETRTEYNLDMLSFGLEECILNNDTFYNTLEHIKGIDTLSNKQINTIINDILLIFKDSFEDLAKHRVFEYDTFVNYQTLICNLIIEKIKKLVDNQ